MAAGLLLPGVIAAQQDTSAATKRAVTVSGYVTASVTHSSTATDGAIVGRLYDRRRDEPMLNVLNLTVERVAAVDRRDVGFRVEGWLGSNAALVKSVGLDLGTNADLWQAYATLNLPLAGASRYVQLKAGKMATLMGVEVGEDILNPNADVSYQDIVLEPFTETGVEVGARFSPQLDAQLRLTNGWDQVRDVNAGKSVMARLGVTPDDRTQFAVVGYAGPEQSNNARNLRAGVNVVASRKMTQATTALVQVDYGHERAAAAGGGDAAWTAAGAWVTHDLSSAAALAVRADVMNDRNGTRTSNVLGFAANVGQTVGSATATATIRRWAHLLARPELRYDHSTLRAFGGHHSQLSLGAALSYIF